MNKKNGELYHVFSGNSNPVLAVEVCRYLGISIGKANVSSFSDGEIRVEVIDSVRNRDVFILQSTCVPVNDNLFELLLLIDALKRASAKSIVAVLPYFGYARQDRRIDSRVPISAKLVADLLVVAGVSRIITLDLHANQIQGFFNVPVDNLCAACTMYNQISSRFTDEQMAIVSPDLGGAERARAFAKRFECGFAIIDKHRSAPNKAVVMAVLGDVSDKIAVIYDDMVDTAGTLIEVADALVKRGAKSVYACCTHPVLSGYSIGNIVKSKISKLFVADTIPLSDEARKCDKIEVLTVANLVGEAIFRNFTGVSMASLIT